MNYDSIEFMRISFLDLDGSNSFSSQSQYVCVYGLQRLGIFNLKRKMYSTATVSKKITLNMFIC